MQSSKRVGGRFLQRKFERKSMGCQSKKMQPARSTKGELCETSKEEEATCKKCSTKIVPDNEARESILQRKCTKEGIWLEVSKAPCKKRLTTRSIRGKDQRKLPTRACSKRNTREEDAVRTDQYQIRVQHCITALLASTN